MSILVITFTKAAALEMKERFQRPDGRKRSCPVTFGTFHSVFFWILRQAYGLSAANIIREEQKYQFLREASFPTRTWRSKMKMNFLPASSARSVMVKNDRIPLENYYSKNCSEELFRKFFNGYQEKLQNGTVCWILMICW